MAQDVYEVKVEVAQSLSTTTTTKKKENLLQEFTDKYRLFVNTQG